MGTLYRETVAYRHRKSAKFYLLLIALIMLVDFIIILSDLKRFIREFVYLGYGIIPFAIIITFIIWVKCKTKFRYAIIDNELIIERFNGNKRKVELSLNAKHILKIEKVSSRTKRSEIDKDSIFLCTKRLALAYKVTYEKEGNIYSFYFEPSSRLINKLNELIKK